MNLKKNTDNLREPLYNVGLLRAAILRRAVADYISAIRKRDYYQIAKLERFFLGAWGELLSGDHGQYIIDHCRKLANKKQNIQKSIDNF